MLATAAYRCGMIGLCLSALRAGRAYFRAQEHSTLAARTAAVSSIQARTLAYLGMFAFGTIGTDHQLMSGPDIWHHAVVVGTLRATAAVGAAAGAYCWAARTFGTPASDQADTRAGRFND